MTARTPNFRRSRLERLSLSLAGTIAVICAITAAGWWLHLDELLQPVGAYAPFALNAALGFGALGLALLAMERSKWQVAALTLAAAAVGAATLIEYGFARDLRIDELFGRDHLLASPGPRGRMAWPIAACLVISSLVLAWRTTSFAGRLRGFTEACVGTLTASAGLSSVIGYSAGLPSIYTWDQMPVSPVGSIVLVLLGLALVLLAWRDSLRAKGDTPAWSPLPAVVVCLTLTLVLWVGLREREQIYTTQNIQTRLDQFAIETRRQLDENASELERITRVWPDVAFLDRDVSATDRVQRWYQESQHAGCLGVTVVDATYRARWGLPQPNDVIRPPAPVRSEAVRRSSSSTVVADDARPVFAMSPIASTSRNNTRFAIHAPIVRSGETIGFLVADFSYRAFFQNIAAAKARLAENDLSVTLDGDLVFQHLAGSSGRGGKVTIARTYIVTGHSMRVTFTPSPAALARDRRYLPELALAAGVGISILLGLSVQLARSARTGQRDAERLNAKLFVENEERRRIEARLKVSDERLRLALDSTQIGIFEWNVPVGHVYYSSGLWAMLGYEHARMPSTVDAWQALIHPDDLPAYRRRIEAQMNGVTPFIDPEYRVRAHNGDWRWVYTRSKSVVTNSEARPLRIVGTVQDITARREAELALRESQAVARKLSLVAAKTDSPVLIAAPDGRIEWANEAFCRVMEYRLDEVAGCHLTHFMANPDSNPDSVDRIRSGLTRGAGLSTDIVNVSKSGRKSYVHVELQPVRNGQGEIENFIAIETDITARVETERELRRAKSEADEISRAKSEFLASMSHEIRTPMNGVIGMTSLLLGTSLSGEQRDYVHTIRTSGEALLTIINDILDFSKIESGKMELEHTPFELSLCLEEALDLFALQASAKRLELGYHIAPNVPTSLRGDATRLRQVIVNLVNNAVKFTPSGSVSVEVRCAPPPALDLESSFSADGGFMLEFAVRDTGIGIPPERVDRLFKAFSQVDSSTTRKYGGTGLGLAICQRLCELMGGDIRVESTSSAGTEFTFRIRAMAAPASSDSGLSTTPEALRDGWVLCVEDHPVTQARLRALVENWHVECVVVPNAAAALELVTRRSSAPALLVVDAVDTFDVASPLVALQAIKCPRLALHAFSQPPPPAPLDNQPFAAVTKPLHTISFILATLQLFQSRARNARAATDSSERPMSEEIPLRVLLAEDNAVNQKVALLFLERLGYRADAVANGLEAVTTLEARRYDLVLMDLQMPEMDGCEATRQIRRRLPSHQQPKIVALTANAMEGDRELCVAAGMDDYISKPVKIQEIAGAIRRHFGKPEPQPVAELIS